MQAAVGCKWSWTHDDIDEKPVSVLLFLLMKLGFMLDPNECTVSFFFSFNFSKLKNLEGKISKDYIEIEN